MKALYAALAAFQQEVPTIKKNATGYGYKFADLEEITGVIKPLLKKHGLGYSQPLDGTRLKTILFHSDSGESLESSVDIPQGIELKGQNAFQVRGSAITYLRRYSLSSLLGLVTDEDADAHGEQQASGDALARAKTAINAEMVNKGFTTDLAKKAFVMGVLLKSTIDTLNDADAVMDQLEKE